jgi:hypothetical protein
MKITRLQIASRAHAIKQARQTVDKTLSIFDGHNVFDSQRTAELQAVAVILRRAENDIWKKHDKSP